jgi:hypothetical protein
VSHASGAERGWGPASERVGEFEGRSPSIEHEADIAAQAHRVIHIRDGQVERDVAGAAALATAVGGSQ